MPPTPYETAKARVEAGDLSFEAIAALTIAHGEKLVAERDPFAPPTRCPVCGGVSEKYCKACDSSGVFIRTGIFVGHSCSRCSDGARPERCPSKVPGNCGEPRARND